MKIVKSRLCTSQYTERSLDFRFCALQKWNTSNKCCTKHAIMLNNNFYISEKRIDANSKNSYNTRYK